MMRPGAPNPFRPGEPLRAKDLSEIAESAWRGAESDTAGLASRTHPPGLPPITSTQGTTRIYARITGRGSDCANSGQSGVNPAIGLAGPNCYCGIEQISDRWGNVEDFKDGLVFDSFSFPLVEITGNPNVPIDAVVWASPARTGTHYEFEWEPTGITSCKCCCCCVPCSGDMWFTLAPFFSPKCGFTDPIGIDTTILRRSGNCWVCSKRASLNFYMGAPCTLDYTISVCCDPTDKRRCPVFTLRATFIIASGGLAGTYKFCIGPVDMDVDPNACDVLNPDESGGPVLWAAGVSNDAIKCDPYNRDCQCRIVFLDDQPVFVKCNCGICPRTGIPSSFPATLTCNNVVDGSIPIGSHSFTMSFVRDNGDQTINAYGACGGGWVGSFTANNGCTIRIGMACNLDETMALSFTCVAGSCSAGACTAVETARSTCGVGPGMTGGDVHCSPWGWTLTGAGGGTIVLGAG